MFDRLPDHGLVRFLRQRDVGGVLNATFAVLREQFREVLTGFVAIVLPFVLVSTIASALFLRMTVLGEVSGDEIASLSGFPPSYWIALLSDLIGSTFGWAATAGYVRLYRQGFAGSITPGLLWEETQRWVWPTFAIWLLVGIAYFFAAFVIAIVAGIVSMGSSVVAIVLAVLAMLVPAVWLLPYVSVSWASRTLESESVHEALSRSGDLVRGSWAFSFVSIFLATVISIVFVVVLSIPEQIAGTAMALGGVDSRTLLIVLLVLGLPTQALGYAAGLLPALATLFVHGHLVSEKDGADLDEDLDLLDLGPSTSSSDAWSAPSAGSASPPPLPTREVPAPPSREEPQDDDREEPGRAGGFRGGGFQS